MHNEHMFTTTPASVAGYLSTAYDPDCDYVDGLVIERNVGERDHSRLQGMLLVALQRLENTLGIFVLPEQRDQINSSRYRVPDLCVALGDPGEPILTRPPFLCVEILSCDDPMALIQERVDDYLIMGVSFVWVVDPQSKHCYIYSGAQLEHNREGLLYTRNLDIRLIVDELLAQ
jgi:Uma2 family endonuclease